MPNAYIANEVSHNITVIDTTTNSVITTISLPAGSNPGAAAIRADGGKVYILNAASGATVYVIDASTNTVTDTITVASQSVPDAIAALPDGSKLYISNSDSGTIQVVNTSTKAVIATLAFASMSGPVEVAGVAVSPDGTKAYIAVYGFHYLAVVNTNTNSITSTISLGGFSPNGIALSPDGSKAYITSGSNAVAVVDLATPTILATITLSLSAQSEGVAVTPDGSKAYVADYGTGQVTVIDTATNTINTTVTVGSKPLGVSTTLDGTKVYVSNSNSGTVSVIDTVSNTVSATITAGSTPGSFGQFIQQTSTPPMTNIYTEPQGRLTLTSGVPVMTADATAQTSVYYTPYQGNIVPIYDGTNTNSYTFSQLTMTLNTSNQASGNIYDLFVFLNSNVVTIGAGPAWSSTSSRGTGAGTTELQQTNGLWTNKNTITLKNGSTSYSSIPAGQATYLGTMYATANGQTGVQFKPTPAAGGTNNIIGIWNAYNRVHIDTICRDSTASWTNTSGWAKADSSSSNRISWVDGLQQTSIKAQYEVLCTTNTAVSGGLVGINLNSTTAAPNLVGVITIPTTGGENFQIIAAETFPPQLGFNYLQAMDSINGVGVTITYYGSGYQSLIAQLEY